MNFMIIEIVKLKLITNVRKDIMKIKCPTSNPSFNIQGEGQIRNFIVLLNGKIGACNKKIKMLQNMPQRQLHDGNGSHYKSQMLEFNNPNNKGVVNINTK